MVFQPSPSTTPTQNPSVGGDTSSAASASPQPSAGQSPRPLPTGPRPAAPPRRIGDILIEDGLITKQQLEQALNESRATGMPIGAVMVKLGYVTDVDLGKSLAKLHGLQYLDTQQLDLTPEVMSLLPRDFIMRNMVVPISVDHKSRRLEVVMARPDNLKILDEISLITGYRIIPRVSTHHELTRLLDRFYSNRTSSDEALSKLASDLSHDESIYDLGMTAELEAEMAADDAPVVQLVNALLIEAIEGGASDIHIEPQKERLLIRFRIDGILREVKSIPRKMAAAVTSRIKVVSGMDIAERRRPQDGRMKIKIGSQEVDMRVNSLAIQFGEKIVIRILKSNATSGGLEKLGLPPDEIKRIEKMIKAPNGIILVTGPTGSGKTTTLYSCMREINTPERNITTIEDPIEYPLPGINQTQVSHKAGLTFAKCLRAILRQDPDVILVGEIRDEETLDAAIHAAMTGHLVFSTIHTNSTAKTINRLLEMGARPYMVSSSIVGIMAQRLVRRTCVRCRQPYQASAEEMQILGLPAGRPVTLYHGTGCEVCEHSGYDGRVGLYEIMNFSREIVELIDNGASSLAIQDMAVNQGMLTLAMDGKRKVLNGMTTVAEVTRVLGLDLSN